MRTLFAVPTKNRVEIFSKCIDPWLAEITEFDVVAFVEPQDAQKYADAFPNVVFEVIPQNDQGLGYVKKEIKKYATEKGYDLIFKIDDDTKGFCDFRKVLDGHDSAVFIEKNIREFEEQFEKHENLGAVALPYNFHMFDKTKKFQTAKKVQSTYLVRTSLFTTQYDFSALEDFSVGLHCLVNGYKIIKACHVGQVVGVPVGKGKGGCQDFDRKKQVVQELEWLRKMYPPLAFKKVDKPWELEPDMKSIKL